MQEQKQKIHIFQLSFEAFLKDFQNQVQAGYRLDESVGTAYFFSGFGCDMYLETPWIKKDEPEPAPESGPFTKAQMESIEWNSFRAYVKETYGLTDRNRKELIKKVLEFYTQMGFNDSTTQEEYQTTLENQKKVVDAQEVNEE